MWYDFLFYITSKNSCFSYWIKFLTIKAMTKVVNLSRKRKRYWRKKDRDWWSVLTLSRIYSSFNYDCLFDFMWEYISCWVPIISVIWFLLGHKCCQSGAVLFGLDVQVVSLFPLTYYLEFGTTFPLDI